MIWSALSGMNRKAALSYSVRPAVCRAYKCDQHPIITAKALAEMGIRPYHMELHDMRITFCGEQPSIQSEAMYEMARQRAFKTAAKMVAKNDRR